MTSTLKSRSEPIAINATLANAAALVAEEYAAARALNGTLHVNYTLPVGFISPAGHKGGTLRKCDDYFWMETVGAEYASSYLLDRPAIQTMLFGGMASITEVSVIEDRRHRRPLLYSFQVEKVT
jgi:hypothetical protein